ncbi:RNA polymerase sigma factor [Sodalis sp. C49]|uniref:RNA polymerase sigma factor n=1 Tax=unclassified Sodalis (in: enterobacteria) TaxID=2636512 RepID=UPI003965977A
MRNIGNAEDPCISSLENQVPAFEKYYTELYRFINRKLRDREHAEDMAQETFIRALTVTQPVRSHRSLLYRIARNLLIDHYRRPERLMDDVAEDTESAHFAAPSHLQPYECLEKNQYDDLMTRTIEALPPRCREAFILHRFDGLSQKDVARHMGISINMVEKHIIRAMTALRSSNEHWQQEHFAASTSNRNKDGRDE